MIDAVVGVYRLVLNIIIVLTLVVFAIVLLAALTTGGSGMFGASVLFVLAGIVMGGVILGAAATLIAMHDSIRRIEKLVERNIGSAAKVYPVAA